MEYTNREFCIEVWGDYACFTRPELKVERVSYDVITPSAARAIFSAIFWKPAIRWHITRIEILNPVQWISVRRNEVGKTMSPQSPHIFIEDNRQQRSAMLLRDVHYRLTAQMEFIAPRNRPKIYSTTPDGLTDKVENELLQDMGRDENPGKYYAIFERRARKGQCYTQPYLGCREFSANFKYIEDSSDKSLKPPIALDDNLGIMLFDMDFDNNAIKPDALFFRAVVKHGVVEVPKITDKEILR